MATYASTPHIKLLDEIGFGKTMLMPGDPLRSKFIAETFFENPVLVNNIRGVNGYTGYYKGVKVSVMASGMGMPSTDSNWADQYHIPGSFAPIASWQLLTEAVKACEDLGTRYHVGNISSSDLYYGDHEGVPEGLDSIYALKKMGVMALEMESAALYMNAARYNKRALCICTISNDVLTGEETTSEERETSFTAMMKVALDVAVAMENK